MRHSKQMQEPGTEIREHSYWVDVGWAIALTRHQCKTELYQPLLTLGR